MVERYRKIALYLSAGAIVAMAISISLTHILISLIGIFYFVFLITEERERRRTRLVLHPLDMPPFALPGLLLFTWLLHSALVHSYMGPLPRTDTDQSYLLHVFARSELSDLWLFVFGWIVFVLVEERKDRDLMQRAILIFGIVLVLTGFISMFFEFRLSHIITGAGYEPSAENRPQHPSLELAGIILYRPIGLMNTRLTYAGLLITVLPLLAFSSSSSRPLFFKNNSRLEKALFILISVMGLIVLIVNKSRSAIIALGVAATILVLFYSVAVISHVFSKRAHREFPRKSRPGRPYLRSSALTVMGFLVLIVLVVGSRLVSPVEIASRVRNSLNGNFRHTDWQRSVIWKAAGDMIQENPFLGVGPGQFFPAVGKWKKKYVDEHPDTLYFISNTPDGHAHNDLLHLTAVGGLPAGFLFLFLVLWILRLPATTPVNNGETFALLAAGGMGTAAFFLAGIFQCYFQDDEVVGFFWAYVGFLHTMGKPLRHERPVIQLLS